MKGFTEQFEALADGQKKVFGFWTDASKKMMESFASPQKEEVKGQDLLKEWYSKQKALFENAMEIGDPKEAFTKVPEQFQKWVALQAEFSDKWLKYYKDNFDTSIELPKSWNAKTWNDWTESSTKLLHDSIMDKLPENMRPHLERFSATYSELKNYWTTFQKLVEFGIYNKEAVDKYFSPDAYKNIVNQFMGFPNTLNISEMVEQANTFFEKNISQFQKGLPNVQNFMDTWAAQTQKAASMNASPYFQMVADFNEQTRQNLAPYYTVLGPTKEVKAAKILRDIQFTYVAFLVKSAEMQTMVYQAGQNALPKTLKAYYEEYQTKKELPDFQAFFNRYVNVLEGDITKVLESDAYSKLQNEVAKAGLGVKSKTDEFIELAFADLPFVMRSEANDIAQETNALRKKIRTLERRLAEVEKLLPVSDAIIISEGDSTKRTTTRRKTKVD
jgi:hypothetical protein